MSKGKIHLIDDDSAVCAAISLLLKTEGYEVEEYEHALHFLKALKQTSGGCIVTDVRMPEMGGIELISELKKRCIDMPIIVLTGAGKVAAAVTAIKLGAVDFLEKPCSEEALLSAIEEALARYREQSNPDLRHRLALLTPRELEVFNAVVDGLQNPSIAQRLRISVRTVEIHRANAMMKLGARSVCDLVRIAMADGRWRETPESEDAFALSGKHQAVPAVRGGRPGARG